MRDREKKREKEGERQGEREGEKKREKDKENKRKRNEKEDINRGRKVLKKLKNICIAKNIERKVKERA